MRQPLTRRFQEPSESAFEIAFSSFVLETVSTAAASDRSAAISSVCDTNRSNGTTGGCGTPTKRSGGVLSRTSAAEAQHRASAVGDGGRLQTSGNVPVEIFVASVAESRPDRHAIRRGEPRPAFAGHLSDARHRRSQRPPAPGAPAACTAYRCLVRRIVVSDPSGMRTRTIISGTISLWLAGESVGFSRECPTHPAQARPGRRSGSADWRCPLASCVGQPPCSPNGRRDSRAMRLRRREAPR
jgi:hypothetical protein